MHESIWNCVLKLPSQGCIREDGTEEDAKNGRTQKDSCVIVTGIILAMLKRKIPEHLEHLWNIALDHCWRESRCGKQAYKNENGRTNVRTLQYSELIGLS